jgi:hypothetical protein
MISGCLQRTTTGNVELVGIRSKQKVAVLLCAGSIAYMYYCSNSVPFPGSLTFIFENGVNSWLHIPPPPTRYVTGGIDSQVQWSHPTDVLGN